MGDVDSRWAKKNEQETLKTVEFEPTKIRHQIRDYTGDVGEATQDKTTIFCFSTVAAHRGKCSTYTTLGAT